MRPFIIQVQLWGDINIHFLPCTWRIGTFYNVSHPLPVTRQHWWQRMPTHVQQFVWYAMKCSLHLHSNYTCCLSWVWVISQILILPHYYLSPFVIIDMWWWWALNIFQNGLKWLHYRKNSSWDINLNKLHLHHFPPFFCVTARWIYLQEFNKTSLQHSTLITCIPTCEQQTNLFKQIMPMALENLAIAQHCNNLKYAPIWTKGLRVFATNYSNNIGSQMGK